MDFRICVSKCMYIVHLFKFFPSYKILKTV